MRALFLGRYGEEYSRARVLRNGLAKNGVEVSQCVRKGIFGMVRIGMTLLRPKSDIIIATGKPVILLCWLLKWWHRRPIVFDAFISDYDTLVIDRKLVKDGSLKSKLLWWGDKLACAMADHVILDTEEHIDYFVDTFGSKREKFKEVLIGTDDEVFTPGDEPHKGFIVEFHGTFIPLQGIEFILRAAKLLEKHDDIRFDMTGAGQTYEEMRKLADELVLKNVDWRGMQPYAALPPVIRRGDVCLGIFGTTPKTQRVVPNKAFEIISCGKPLITGDTPAARRFFGNAAVLVPCGDPDALAKQILALKRNSATRRNVARACHELFIQKATAHSIGARFTMLLKTWSS